MTTDGVPLFGSTALAERIERVEAQPITTATEAARLRVGITAFVIPIAGGAACYAVRAGCDVTVVTTQPGSKSQQNVQRRGLHLLYTRAVLMKPPS